MTEREANDYFEVFNKAWKFFKAHLDVKNDDDWWKKTIHDAEKMIDGTEKCKEFLTWIMINILHELDRVRGEKYDGSKKAKRIRGELEKL